MKKNDEVKMSKVIAICAAADNYEGPVRISASRREDTYFGMARTVVDLSINDDGGRVLKRCCGEGLALEAIFDGDGRLYGCMICHAENWLCLGTADSVINSAIREANLDLLLSIIASQIGNRSPCEFIELMSTFAFSAGRFHPNYGSRHHDKGENDVTEY